jgi:isocitrate dehydrogenase kinase/phosphatase
VGRLVDAQEYEYLTFHKKYFSDELLKELLHAAKNSVSIQNESIVIKHLYTERKLIPLNIYINIFDEAAAKEALLDYGNAIKDLANANIFAGDIFLKNFGVTRHGRVIFYDYDELCLLTDCHFRKMPLPRDVYEEMAAEPWYHVAENDIFPEEFKTFIGLPESLKSYFESIHGDLFDARFWIETQNKIKAGEMIDDFPYRPQNRLIHP